MKIAAMAAAILVTLCSAAPTKAQGLPIPFTPNDMMPACEAANNLVIAGVNLTRDTIATIGRSLNLNNEMMTMIGVCIGEVNAVLYFTQFQSPKPCVPFETTTADVLSVVVSYLRAHPEPQARYGEFMWIVEEAINRTWHCGEK